MERDKQIRKMLRNDGWQVAIVWECQTRPERHEWLIERVVSFLHGK